MHLLVFFHDYIGLRGCNALIMYGITCSLIKAESYMGFALLISSNRPIVGGEPITGIIKICYTNS